MVFIDGSSFPLFPLLPSHHVVFTLDPPLSPLTLFFLEAVSDLELQTLKQAFDSSAEGGVLSRSQLADVLSDIGFGPVPSDRLFDLFDADGNGEVRRDNRNHKRNRK